MQRILFNRKRIYFIFLHIIINVCTYIQNLRNRSKRKKMIETGQFFSVTL